MNPNVIILACTAIIATCLLFVIFSYIRKRRKGEIEKLDLANVLKTLLLALGAAAALLILFALIGQLASSLMVRLLF